MLEEYLCDTIDGFYNDDEKDWYARIMFFESLYPSPLFETLYEKHFKPNSELLLGLIKAATGNEDRNQAMLHAAGIMRHLSSFRIFREFIIRQTTLISYSKEEKEQIKTLVVNSAKPLFEIES